MPEIAELMQRLNTGTAVVLPYAVVGAAAIIIGIVWDAPGVSVALVVMGSGFVLLAAFWSAMWLRRRYPNREKPDSIR